MRCRSRFMLGSARSLPASGALLLLGALLGISPGSSPAVGADPPPAAPKQEAVSPEAREEALLFSARAYLKLSYNQAARLLPLARQMDRLRAAVLDPEEARLEGVLQTLDPRSEQADGMRQALEKLRRQAREEIGGRVSGVLARLLTREQIALAWRLGQHNPPKYAECDPALLEAEAGFCDGGGYQRMLMGAPPDDRGAALGGELLEELRAEAEALRAEAESREVQARRFLEALPEDSRLTVRGSLMGGRRPGGWSGPQPFPQWVVETDDRAGLAKVIAPLGGRLFASRQWTGVLESALRQGLGKDLRSGSSTVVTMGPMRQAREYRLEAGFRNLLGPGPEVEPLGGTVRQGLYVFGPGQGLRLADTGVSDHYAVQILFIREGGEGYQKLIDFKGLGSDMGLYTYQGHVTFYTLADGGAPTPGREHRLRLERNRHSRIVRGYLDWRPIFAFLDLDDEAVFEKRGGFFFVDDTQTGNEQGTGACRSLSVWGPAPRS